MSSTNDPALVNARRRGLSRRPHATQLGWAVGAVLLLVLVGLLPLPTVHSARAVGAVTKAVAPRPALPTPHVTPVAGLKSAPGGLQCAGMYWADWVWTTYSPSWCYGHDEPTMTFVSSAPGSGGDANYSLTLPADGTYTQGDFYGTIWFGGVVYDPGSLGNQAYLELQVYPAPPAFTGPGSGANDCLPNGAFNPVYTPGSNTWFACAVVWQITSNENAVFAGPLDTHGTTSILQFQSNDHLYVNLTGVAQSTTQPWQITVTDTTTTNYGTVALQNGSKVLPPYYDTAAAANVLTWGASRPGAVAVSYEIGHALNLSIPQGGPLGACYPGDGACDSYWPGRWGRSGQLQLTLPIMGVPASRTFPAQIGFSSSAGGESWVNNTGAGSLCSSGPSWSTGTNCLYPWYIYRAQNYSFTFDANNLTNGTHDYGNWYQFPGVSSSHATFSAPWGTVNSVVTPTTATVDFNPLRTTHRVTVLPSGGFSGQFMEGPYWLNVSAPRCTSSSTFVYLKTGAVYNTPVVLSCGGVYAVTFNESGLAPGTPWSVTYNGSYHGATGTTIVFYAVNGTRPYSVPSPVPGATGIQYVASPSTGNVVVNGLPVMVPISFATQYQFTGMASPSPAGVVTPASVWTAAGGVVQATATPNSGWAFTSWGGVGVGNYSGTANPALVTMRGPVQETALFVLLYAVSFSETGLPSGATWRVTLNGQVASATAHSILFQRPNGSISYTISGPAGYSVTPSSGSDTINGKNVSVQVQFAKPLFLGLTPATWELLALLVLAVVVAIILAVALTRRKRPPPGPPVPAAQPPPWVRGPPPP